MSWQRIKEGGGRALFLFLTAVPLVFGLGYALLYGLGLTGILSQGFTGRHIVEVWREGRLLRSLGFSFFIAAASMSLATATALWWTLRYRRVFQSRWMSHAAFLPLVFPAIVTAFVAFQLLSKGGLLARLCWHLGLIGEPRQFADLINDPWGVGIILAHFLMATPFLSLLFRSIYEQQGVEALCQVARSLGCSPGQRLRRVTLPILLKKGRPTLLLYGVFVSGSYEVPLLLGAQDPQMISVYTVTKLSRFDLSSRPQAYLIALAFALLVLVILALVRPDKE